MLTQKDIIKKIKTIFIRSFLYLIIKISKNKKINKRLKVLRCIDLRKGNSITQIINKMIKYLFKNTIIKAY
ncbi:hypothetical protein D1W98_05545 [Campylobacter jejuni]|uniref:Uncharacterized protein n=1 Tax=Campylobacter jejuni TaxID=197 RepID=A0A5T1CZ41_CAMJU|nr:hypothetical protein RC21_04440 [Campylobacter jejuni]EIB84003.1 hypothetical protein cje89_08639 [Campylobacter jejuni subsp. jejuni LMG 9872]NWL53901.1 hypothetical protein [Campylobacter jejuni subsp. jejuni]ALV96863.1 hypothetical protein RC36_04565 [Campylobacter jejuni]ALV98423.1 hypothetical protein RC38_04345 [Campylobacter jejuni]